MLNKKEKDALCEYIATLELNENPTGPAAYALSECGQSLARMFNLSDEDLSFHRCNIIHNRLFPNDESLDDWDLLTRLEDEMGWAAFYEAYCDDKLQINPTPQS